LSEQAAAAVDFVQQAIAAALGAGDQAVEPFDRLDFFSNRLRPYKRKFASVHTCTERII
jgi:hypothetical protein